MGNSGKPLAAMDLLAWAAAGNKKGTADRAFVPYKFDGVPGKRARRQGWTVTAARAA